MQLNVRRGDADGSTINLLEDSMPNDDGSIGRYLAGLTGGTKYPALVGLASTIPSSPALPTFTFSDIQESRTSVDNRYARLQELLPIRCGRTIPDVDGLLIGDARRLTLAILFLDICKFSSINSATLDEQTRVLTILNLFMAEMLRVVKKNGGEFEKNTGDGLMAYFKSGSERESTQVALETAVAMHFFNDNVITPKFTALGLPHISFRVGIEAGEVIVANVGVKGDHHSIVAVGNTANVACKMMSLIEHGGIVIGHHTLSLLPYGWSTHTKQVGVLPNFNTGDGKTPYPVWSFDYRAQNTSNIGSLLALMGGASALGGRSR
jgi:class 3 adenylate cyclase